MIKNKTRNQTYTGKNKGVSGIEIVPIIKTALISCYQITPDLKAMQMLGLFQQ